MKKAILLMAALIAAGVAPAAVTPASGSCESKAISLSPSTKVKTASVKLVPEVEKNKAGAWVETGKWVCYYKMTLKKKKAYSIWLSDLAHDGVAYERHGVEGNNLSNATIRIEGGYPKWSSDWSKSEPIAQFESAPVGDYTFWVVSGKEWAINDDWGKASSYVSGADSDMDWGDFSSSTPSSWTYYIRISGKQGETATLHYAIGNKIPIGIEQNPLVLTAKNGAQTTGDMEFWSEYYFVQMAMKNGCRYHLTSAGGRIDNVLTIDYGLPYGTIRDVIAPTENDFAKTVIPLQSGTYLIAIKSTAEEYTNATCKLTYSVDKERTMAEHVKAGLVTPIVANVPTNCVPGNLNTRGSGTFDAIIDESLFSFVAAKGQNYVVETEDAATNLLMRLYDAKGNIIVENRGNGSDFNVRCALSAPSKKATYYVGVCQDLGVDDDILDPVRWPVKVVLRPIASTHLANQDVSAVPAITNALPAVWDPTGTAVPDLCATNWYDMFALNARKGIVYRFGATWVDPNAPTNGYALAADLYQLKSGKQKAVLTGFNLTVGNVLTFTAAATTTYYLRLRVKEGYALDYPQVRLHAIGYSPVKNKDGKVVGCKELGILKVTPEGTASAKWTIDKESVKYGIGASILLEANKSQTVKFTSVKGYATPKSVSVTIPANDTVAVAGTDARYVDSVEPKDNVPGGATKWTLKHGKDTGYTRTLWYYGKGDAPGADPADHYLITPKDGLYYTFSLPVNDCNAAFDIYRSDGVYYASNVMSVAKLQLPKSASKYYVIVHRNKDVAPEAEGTGVYKITGQYAEVGTIAFAKTAVSVKDNANTVKLTVKRSAKDGKVAVRYYTVDGTARAGEHYIAQTNVLTWAAKNKSNKTITIKMIPKLGAWHDGGNKTFFVELEPLPADDVRSDYVAQIKTPVCTVTRTETGLDKKKNPITQESVYAKAAAKVATVKKTEDVSLETGTFVGYLHEQDNALTNGLPEFASVTLTSAAATAKKAAALTAKVTLGGKAYTFKSTDGWDRVEEGDGVSNCIKTLRLVQKINKVSYTNECTVALPTGEMTSNAWMKAIGNIKLRMNVPDANGKGAQAGIRYEGGLIRKNEKVQGYLDEVVKFAGYYTVALVAKETKATDRGEPDVGTPEGNGYVTMTISNKGVVKLAGLLPDGTKISSSTVAALIPVDNGPLGFALYVPVYQAKSPYVLAGELWIEAVPTDPTLRPDGRAYDLVVSRSLVSFLVWNNDNGSLTHDGRQGWRKSLVPVGGWYDKIVNLQNYYRDYAYQVKTIDEISEFPKEVLPSGYNFVTLGPGDDISPDGVGVELSGNGLAAGTRKLTKTGKTYKWAEAVNPCNVKVKFARATGIASGTLSLWSEKPGTKPVAKEITGFKHYGILTMDRDADNPIDGLCAPDAEVFTTGFLLKDVKIPVTKKKSRTWKFSTPFDIVLPSEN